MKKLKIQTLEYLGSFVNKIRKKSTRTENVIPVKNFFSPELNNKRTIMVYLPPGYNHSVNADKRYPVLYMHDGNNLFDEKTSYIGVEWGLDKHANHLIDSDEIKPFIAIGIYNNPDRDYEYTPVFDKKVREGGRGDLYLKFIVETLKPWVDVNYRTLDSRIHTGIGGSSLGGLISLYAVLKHTDVFGFAAVISPSLWWGNKYLHKYARNTEITEPLKIWMDMGTKEGRPLKGYSGLTTAMRECRTMTEILKGFTKLDICYREYKGARHNEKAWSDRTDDYLRYFFREEI